VQKSENAASDVSTDTLADSIVITDRESSEAEAEMTIDDITITEMDRSIKDDAGDVLIKLTYDLVQLPETTDTYRAINQLLLREYQNSSVNDDYSNYLEDPYLDPAWPYNNSTSAQVSYLTEDYLCITYSWSWYMGGVNNYGTYGKMYNLSTGEEETLDKVLGIDPDALLALLKNEIKDYIVENNIACFDDAYDTIRSYTLEDLSFTFSDNQLIICIPEYELAPGSEGPLNIETGLYIGIENDTLSTNSQITKFIP
jgi:hypothetical protein